MLFRAICLIAVVTSVQSAHLRSRAWEPESLEAEMFDLSQLFDAGSSNASNASGLVAKVPGGADQDPKCDQACTNGGVERRAKCLEQCAKMQKIICPDKFTCHKGCANDNKYLKHDQKCADLCNDVYEHICVLEWEAPKDMKLSPHHDEKPPPSVEATPAPRIYTGSFMFCNLYAASYAFDIVRLKTQDAKDGETMAKLHYKQCQNITMASAEAIGLRAKGKMSAVSKPIVKTPSIMMFGQFAFGNHQIEFNRYYAKGDGPIICNGFPVWESKDLGEKVVLYRNNKTLSTLRYKECMPTGLKNGDVLKAEIKGKKAGEYRIGESPNAIVLGKAGDSGALAFEAWVKGPETGF